MTDDERLEAAHDGGRPYAERLALLDEVGSLDAEARALRGDILRFLGRVDESEAEFAALLAGAPEHRALARIGLANVRAARADWAGARTLLEEVLAEAEALDQELVGRVHGIVASTWFNEHDLARAEASLERAAAVQRGIRDRAGEAVSLTSLGVVAFARGASSRAFALLEEGRALAARFGQHHWAAMAESYLAMLRHEAGDLESASAFYDGSIAALERLGVRRAEGLTLFGRAMLRVEHRAFDAAAEDLRDALSNERATSPDYEPLLAAALALVAVGRGDREARDHQLAFARDCAGRRGDRFRPMLDALAAALVEGAPFPASWEAIESRLLARAVESLARAPRRRLRLGEACSWFELDEHPRVDLARRRPLRRLLAALVERHREPQKPPLSVEALVKRGWPDERLVAATGATRLYSAIATLRKMGLEGALERRGEGYALTSDLWCG
jgi:tetratricopeptide (TPR) repeat protein